MFCMTVDYSAVSLSHQHYFTDIFRVDPKGPYTLCSFDLSQMKT